MKLLRNPVVVGALALIAVVVVAIQLGPLFMPSISGPRPNIGTPPHAVTTPTPQPVGSPAPQPKAPVGASIDIPTIEASSARWNSDLKKDPFQARHASIQSTNPPARDLLTLNAVWRQTAGDFAVINNRIVAPGDRILTFSVSRIEPDAVWVDSTNGLERIEFTGGMPTPAKSKH